MAEPLKGGGRAAAAAAAGGGGGGEGKKEASKRGYDFSKSIESITQKRFDFETHVSQPLTVDQTLARLFDTLSVECSGILVHPQWKHFRHIRMIKNDQIRLSNGIWRSWHLQFQKRRNPLYCRFDIDANLDHHQRQEAVVLEGKYWKRKTDAVASEYRKWRFYREKDVKKRREEPSLDGIRATADKILSELAEKMQKKPQEMQVDPPRSFLQSLEDYDERFPMDTVSEPMADYSAYDMMVQQPKLDVLNPMMEDFLNKFSEPMDIMMGRPQFPGFVGNSASVSSNSSPAFISPTHRPQSVPQPPTTYPPSSQHQQQQQQQPQQMIPVQMPLEPLQAISPSQPKDMESTPSIMQQELYPSADGFSSYLGYQELQVSDQSRYSPSAFLSVAAAAVTSQPEKKGALLDIQQAGNIALKCEPSSSSMDDQLSLDNSSSHESSFYQSPGPLSGSFQGRRSGGGDMPRAEGVYRTHPSQQEQQQQQQQQKSSSDSALNSVLSQFYQTNELVENLPLDLGMLAPSTQHISPGHQQPQPGVGGGAFQFPPQPATAAAAATSPMSTTMAGQPQRRPMVQGGAGGGDGMSQFVRVSSAGDLSAPATAAAGRGGGGEVSPNRPPLQRGKSEPIRHLQDKVRNLSAQHHKQMEELDKQKSMAEVQFSEMMKFVPQGKTGASEQQQAALQSVLSDPNLVKILRTVLSVGPDMQQQQQHKPINSPPLIAPAPPRRSSTGTTTSPVQPAGQSYAQHAAAMGVLSPTQLRTGLSDLQSQLMSEAAASSSSSAASFSGGSEITSPTQTMIKKFKNSRNLSSTEKQVYKEMRRQSHISAEQKRRGSIKQGFDQLQSLVINASAYPSGKVSKAVILEKTLEHIQRCHAEKESRERQMKALKARIEELNGAIALCQEKLPASGVPVTRQRFEENRQRFRSYIQKRTLQNYKFGIFSIILQQLFEPYNSMVSIGTVDELCRTVLAWFEQNCNLPSLRPIVMNSLKELSQRTSILSDPSQVPRQLTQYAQQSAQDQHQDMMTRRRLQEQQHQQQQQQQQGLSPY